MVERPPSGHRLLPHVADVILEAWGTSRVDCLQEAARGLIESFADVEQLTPTDRVPVELVASGDEEALLALLDEVIYVVDVLGLVPVDVHLDEPGDGTVRGSFETIPVDEVEATGALPKGVSRSDLVFTRSGRGWRCHAVVDV